MQLLVEPGAPVRLQKHAELVGEAADALLEGLARCGVPLRVDYVRVGVVLHDVGKAIHRDELDAPGAAHEAAGERLLLARGASPEVARVCRSHARWNEFGETLEELVIALSDKLWKGARVRELEELVVDRAASAMQQDRWGLYIVLDALFEDIASGAESRLSRSQIA